MLRQGRRVARLREQGFLHVYVFDGKNSFDRVHHSAISLLRSFSGERLLRLEAVLRERVAEFDPTLGPFTMPYPGGTLAFGSAS